MKIYPSRSEESCQVSSIYFPFTSDFTSNLSDNGLAILADGRKDPSYTLGTFMLMTKFQVAHDSSAISHVSILDLPREKQF